MKLEHQSIFNGATENTHGTQRVADLSQNNIKINVISNTSSVAGNIVNYAHC